MNNLIELLKDNEKPFALMSDEMLDKAQDLGSAEFRAFHGSGWGEIPSGFCDSLTYRLRPDYEDEPEIVECEIQEDGLGKFHYNRPDGLTNCSLSNAVNYSDFIGFKFKDGCWRTSPIYYQMPTFCNDQIHPDKTSDFAAKIVLHATHVLFRRKKQE